MPPNYIKEDTKRCNGLLHQGQYIPLDSFWIHKSGKRKGKPFSQCKDCLNFYRWGDTLHGWVEVEKVKFIFEELKRRLGKAEASRRMGVSHNFYRNLERRKIDFVRKDTVKRGMIVLMKCRENNEVRHRDSISHGAKARGHKERVVIYDGCVTENFTNLHQYYIAEHDGATEKRRRKRELTRGLEMGMK